MTLDENRTKLDVAAEYWRKFRANPVVRAIVWARWLITVAGFLATILWYAYVEGQDISENLSKDYAAVQAAQGQLIDESLSLQQVLLNSNVSVDLKQELDDLRTKAKATIGAIGALRAPTSSIETAQKDYRAALEVLIGVTNRLERGEIQDMALPLNNSLQGVANAGGDFNVAVRDFQGGMLPQLMGSIF